MLIARRAVEEYLGRDFEDFRWMKKLSRAQMMAELNQMHVKPVFKTEPWLHQLVCFYIGLMYPRFLFLLDMGLGKSKILSDLITHTQRERKLEGALITVPRLINIDSWEGDLAVHSDLEPCVVNVKSAEEKWEKLITSRADVSLIDYAGLHLAMCKKEKSSKGTRLVRDDKKVKMLVKRYNWMGLDECHKLKNHENLWFMIADALSKRMEYVYATTGTLFGSNVEDLWSQFYLVDRGETFGENLGPFRKAFFTAKMNPWQKGPAYTYDKAMHATLHRMLQHRSLRYDEDEVEPLPKQVPFERVYEMGDEQREHYMRALQGLINCGGGQQDLEAAWLRMRQITSGYLAWNDEHGKHVLPFKVNPKLDGLEALVEEMGDSKFVVCYDYTETGRMICARLKSMGVAHEWFYGGTRDKSASRERFLSDPKCRGFVMNSAAGGTGNDGLQKVARYMVFYESPTPPDTRKQTEKRIHRPGKTGRSFVYDLVMKRSVDRGILDNIKEGIDCYDAVVNGRRGRAPGFFLR